MLAIFSCVLRIMRREYWSTNVALFTDIFTICSIFVLKVWEIFPALTRLGWGRHGGRHCGWGCGTTVLGCFRSLVDTTKAVLSDFCEIRRLYSGTARREVRPRRDTSEDLWGWRVVGPRKYFGYWLCVLQSIEDEEEGSIVPQKSKYLCIFMKAQICCAL
jgi:hypothetical protein